MKKLFVLSFVAFFSLATMGVAFAEGNSLKDQEKKVVKEFLDIIPQDHIINLEQFKEVVTAVRENKKDAYLLDVRTHEEFYAFHIEGTDHISAGVMYTVPKKIKDPNAEIYVFCRTGHRAKYFAGFLYKYGYKNVYLYDGGVVEWAEAGNPVVNQFTGQFKIIDYQKAPSDLEKSFRIRDFHPY